jgi:Ser/Thr protein kinase RdoA (MazF antagonist)
MKMWKDELPAALAGYGRSAAYLDCKLLSLTENATYLVPPVKPLQDPLILRLNRPGYRTPDQINSEVAWIKALRADQVVTTPAIIPNQEGSDVYWFDGVDGPQQAVAFEYVLGREPGQGDWVDCFGRLGRITAKLHRHARAWVAPAGFTRPVWRLNSMLGVESDYGHWSANQLISAPQQEVLAQAEAKVAAEVAAYGSGSERFGLIHFDLRLANLLVDGKRINVIDFDDCGHSWYLMDLACALSFNETDPRVPAMISSWLHGYSSVKPLTGHDLRIIPAFIMLRRLQLTAWMERRHDTELADHMRRTDYVGGTRALAQEYLDGTLFAAALHPATAVPEHQIGATASPTELVA